MNTKRKWLALPAVALVTVVLSGCGSSISSGVITQKVHEPAHTWVTIQYCGKGCIIPVTHYDDEDWRFDIREDDETGWVYVTPETFDAYTVGDYFQAQEDNS